MWSCAVLHKCYSTGSRLAIFKGRELQWVTPDLEGCPGRG